MSAIDWYGARLAREENRFSRFPYLRLRIFFAADMYVQVARVTVRLVIAKLPWTSFKGERERKGRGALASFVPESLRANSLSGNWVFSFAIRRLRYIYVGCSIREERRKGASKKEAGWGSNGDRERIVRSCGTNGGQTRNGVLGELSTTTCDRCPSRD